MRPDLVMKSVIPCLMAGMIGIYGLIIGILIGIRSMLCVWFLLKLNWLPYAVKKETYSPFNGFAHLGSGLAVGFSGLGAGMCIGVVGDIGVRSNALQPRLFTGLIMILIFAEGMKI